MGTLIIAIWIMCGILTTIVGVKRKIIFPNEPEFRMYTVIFVFLGPFGLIAMLLEKKG